MDSSQFCCLATVKRWAYVISENICSNLHIILTSGKHFPIEDYPRTVDLDYSRHESHFSTLRNHIPYRDYSNINVTLDSNFNGSFYTLENSYGGHDLNSTTSTNFTYLGKWISYKLFVRNINNSVQYLHVEQRRDIDGSFTWSFQPLLLQGRGGGRGRGRGLKGE